MSIDDVLRKDLTGDQYDAAVDTNNEVLCIACAGSGKSRTIAYRVSRLLSEGAHPDSIVVITFTEKAAESIKLMIASTLPRVGMNPELIGAMFVGTVHSFCKNLLGEIDARYRQFEVLDGNRLILYLISRYHELHLRELKEEKGVRYFQTIKSVSDAWWQLNNECLDIEEILNVDPTLGLVLSQLRECLIRDQFIDYALMIRLVLDYLENDNGTDRNAINHINHIMVDEYQDTYPLQDRLFRKLHKYSDTIFVVGDDDQAIYGWNGADVTNIIDFNKHYPNVTNHTLSTNFRSNNIIVDSSSIFISRQLGTQRMPKNPRAYPANNEMPSQVGKFFFNTRNEEAEWVADRIQFLLGKAYIEKDGTERGLTPGDFAILMKSTLSNEQDGTERHFAYSEELRGRGIDPLIESEGSIFNYPSVMLLHDLFELLRHNDLERPELVTFYNERIVQIFSNCIFSDISRVISEWQRNIHEPGRRKVKPQQLLHDILEAFDFANTSLPQMEMRAIGKFSQIMNDVESVYFSIDTSYRFTSILNFINYLRNPITSDDYEVKSDIILQRPDAIFISTIHKAKGLEFPVVFVVDVQSGRFPGRTGNYNGWLPIELMQPAITRGAYQNNREGEIRAFYTALTRAERYLYITGCEMLPGGTRHNRESVFTQELVHDSITEEQMELPTGIIDSLPLPRIADDVLPTSFSDIRYYLNCPRNYKFRKIYGFNPVVPDLYGYGLTIHTAIGKLHQLYTDTTPNTDQTEQISEEIFHLKHVPKSNDPENNPGPYERGLEKAKELVNQYVTDYGDEFSVEKQIEQRFEIPALNTVISGSIDLLVREDSSGNLLDVKVIDFKSLNQPDEGELLDWIELSLQVQLYAKAANEVLSKNACTGAVHLLRDNIRVEVPISKDALIAAINNIEWAVQKIINNDFPMRPAHNKCENCDFKSLCNKNPAQFKDDILPSPIHVPNDASETPLMIKAFSEIDDE